MKLESRIQADCVRWFTNHFCLKHHQPRYCIFAVPNEAIQKMAWKQISKFKATGLKSGVSDLVVLLPEKTLFIEMKTDTGRQSKPQKNFQRQVEGLGFKYFICRSLREFKEIISKEL